MFRFTIRDVLRLTVVVAVALLWFRAWSGWQEERRMLLFQRDKDVDNERRLGELRAKEAAEVARRNARPPGYAVKAVDKHEILNGDEPTPELPLRGLRRPTLNRP